MIDITIFKLSRTRGKIIPRTEDISLHVLLHTPSLGEIVRSFYMETMEKRRITPTPLFSQSLSETPRKRLFVKAESIGDDQNRQIVHNVKVYLDQDPGWPDNELWPDEKS